MKSNIERFLHARVTAQKKLWYLIFMPVANVRTCAKTCVRLDPSPIRYRLRTTEVDRWRVPKKQ